MRFGIIRFSGSTGEHDVAQALLSLGHEFDFIWYTETSAEVDALILPGGYSYGDYIRPGAFAAHAPVMELVREFANTGKPVLGIGNGFQILCEAGILPGAFLPNKDLKHMAVLLPMRVDASCDWLDLEIGEVLPLPVSHSFGNYYCDAETLAKLQADERIVLRHSNDFGETDEEALNGSLDNIAAICNEGRNVLGLMAHIELAVEPINSLPYGVYFFDAVEKGAAS